MLVTNKKPAPIVSECVQDILIIEHNHVTVPFSLPLFANGTPTLLFHTAKRQLKNCSNHLTLFGQTILPENLQINDSFTLVAYFLKPDCIMSLFGVSARELTDNPVDFNLLSRKSDLQEQLLNSKTVDQMILLLDHYILSLMSKNKPRASAIKYAIKKLSESPGKSNLSQIRNEICVTERTLQRMFEIHIGVSPNQFKRIIQFSGAFRQLNQGLFQNLSDIAYSHFYSDQSHFIRAFKEFTNLTPKEYLRLRTAC